MLLAALLCCAQRPAPSIQPGNYTSPNGRRQLSVEPNAPRGATAARYRATLDKAEVWSAELPFVLRDAALGDDGRIAGWAIVIGATREEAKLLVTVFSPAGEVVSQVAHPLRPEWHPHGGPDLYFPRVEDIVLQPELDRFVAWIFGPENRGHDEELWIYDLSTGAQLAQRLQKLERNDWCKLLGLRPVPETPLLLVSWCCSDYSSKLTRRDAVFQLLDRDAQPVWSLEFEHDYDGPFGQPLPILATLPGRFELRRVATKERILFEVEPAGEGWRVDELSHFPYSDEKGPPWKLKPRWIARVPLGTASADPVETRLEPAHERILLEDRDATVHVFDLQGQELSRFTFGAEERVDWSDLPQASSHDLALAHDGSIDAGFFRRRVRYSTDGTRSGIVAIQADHVALRPDANGYWAIRGQALVRLTADGKVELQLEKRPDGRWFSSIVALDVARDGSVAVLEGNWSPRFFLADAELSLFDREGKPVRVVAIPDIQDGIEFFSLSYQAGRALLAGPSSTLLLELATRKLSTLELVESPEVKEGFKEFALSADGRELWVLRRARRELVRYELPE